MALHFIELVALGWAMAAPDEVIPVRVEFDSPAGCSSADAFYAAMRARTDRVRRAQAGERALGLRVRLSREGAGVHGELGSIEDEVRTEMRAMEGATCDEVVDALSFTAALAIDPNARFEPKPPSLPKDEAGSSPTSNPETDSKSERKTAKPEPRPPKPRDPDELDRHPSAPLERDGEHASPSEPHRVELGVQLSGLELLSSELGLGAGLLLRLSQKGRSLTNTSFGLGLLHVRNDLFTSAERVSARWTGVVLSACPLRFTLRDELAILPCGVGMGGWLHARGRNLSNPESANRSWWSAGGVLRGAAELAYGATLELEVGLTIPLVRRRFITVADEPVGQSARSSAAPRTPVGQTPEIAPIAGVGLVHPF